LKAPEILGECRGFVIYGVKGSINLDPKLLSRKDPEKFESMRAFAQHR
jgi:hypothetical protein